MKKEYIQPEIELIVCRLSAILEGSDPNTNWTIGGGEIGPGPDPEGAKQSSGFWEGAPQSPNIWGDEE